MYQHPPIKHLFSGNQGGEPWVCGGEFPGGGTRVGPKPVRDGPGFYKGAPICFLFSSTQFFLCPKALRSKARFFYNSAPGLMYHENMLYHKKMFYSSTKKNFFFPNPTLTWPSVFLALIADVGQPPAPIGWQPLLPPARFALLSTVGNVKAKD